MSTVLILSPVIISSWPAISAAAVGAATALGLAIQKSGNVQQQEDTTQTAVIELSESEVLAQSMASHEDIVFSRDNVTLRVGRDDRGRCTVCASGKGYTKAALEEMAQEFSQKMTQCFVYNRVTSELDSKGFSIVNEEITEDESVRIHIRRWED